MPDITYDVGRVSFVMKGAWNLATSYEKLDVVSYNGSLYIAKQDVPGGTAITNTTYWQLAVEKGDQGETGNGIASITLTGTAGNVDTYTITFTDGTTTTFTVTNGGVTTVNGRTGDVTGLAEEDGSYPLLNAGTADNLTPYSEDSGATQDIPFIAQGTGCGNGESVVDTGSYLQFKKKLGNTVAVNQSIPIPPTDGSAVINGITFTDNRDGSWTVSGTASADVSKSIHSSGCPSGRKVIFFGCPAGGSATTYFLQDAWTGYRDEGKGCIETSSTAYDIRIVVKSGTVISTPLKFTPKRSDLSLWYGSDANIPSDLLSHPENWGRYYAGSLAYAAGYLDSADGTVLKSIGRQVWDEEWENGSIDSFGHDTPSTRNVRPKNYISVIPNTQYYFYSGTTSSYEVFYYDADKNFIRYIVGRSSAMFTTPSNCAYIRFVMYQAYGTTYKNDITISLYYPGESGYSEYYPYSVLADVDTGSEVLRSAGAVADEKTPDGTITRRVGVVDLGTLTWTRDTSGTSPTFWANVTGMLGTDAVVMCSKYTYGGSEGWSTVINGNYEKEIVASQTTSTPYVMIQDSAYSDAATFKTAMSGVYLYYELATPTTEQGTAFAENIPCDDFGSMYWTQTKGIPQGNEIFYPVDYKASIDTLYKRVGGDMSKIVTEDEYPEAPSSDGTYVLKATVSGGTKTYAWVAE